MQVRGLAGENDVGRLALITREGGAPAPPLPKLFVPLRGGIGSSSSRRSAVWAVIVAAACGCGVSPTSLVGGDTSDDGESADVGPEAQPDDSAPLEEVFSESGELTDDAFVFLCPIWAVAVGTDPRQYGTREFPYHGLQAALDARGACDHVILGDSPGAPQFDIAVDVELKVGETLIIEGDTAATSAPVLDGWGVSTGLRAWGEGALVLRRLAVRGGVGMRGGCLDAAVESLELDETRWEGCRAEENGGAIAVSAASLQVLRSSFRANAAGRSGGGMAIDGTRLTTILVDQCEFRENRAASGGALAILAPTTEAVVRASRFVANQASEAGSAVSGYIGGRIDGNRFERNESGAGGGAVAGEGGWHLAVIAHNVFVANRATCGGDRAGFCGAAVDLRPAYATIRNNLFLRNETTLVPERCPGIGAVQLGFGRPVVVNNVFVGNIGREGVAHLSAENADVRNNVFVEGVGYTGCVLSATTGEGAALDYNLDWMTPGWHVLGLVNMGTHGMVADPRFVDAAAGDYSLASDSPGIDRGDPADEFLDADGTRNDMGAFGGPDGNWVPLGPEEE